MALKCGTGNAPFNITINNIILDGWSAVSALSNDDAFPARESCYNGKAYDNNDLFKTVQCLPASGKSGDPWYEWGFSTVLTSLILICHCIWSLFIFGLYLDGELNGSLQREANFEMSQIRAALIVAEAATRTTDRSLTYLIGCSPKEIMKILGRKDATIPFEVLRQEPDIPLADVRSRADDQASASSLLQESSSVQESHSDVVRGNENEIRGSTDLTEENILPNARS